MREILHDLQRRVQKAKLNLEGITQLMKVMFAGTSQASFWDTSSWDCPFLAQQSSPVLSSLQDCSATPLFGRKDNKETALLDLEGKEQTLAQRRAAIEATGEKIQGMVKVRHGPGALDGSQGHEEGLVSNVRSQCFCWVFTDKHWLVFSRQENATLFKADLSSKKWLAYVGYIDKIVLDGLCRLVHITLQMLLTNMAPDVGSGVLAVGVPVPGSGCPPSHCHFGQRPNVTVAVLPAARRAVGLRDMQPHTRH